MNNKTKIQSIGLTILGIGLTIASNIVAERKMNETIEEKVEAEVTKRLQSEK